MSDQEFSPSRAVAIKTIGKAFELLKTAGGEMSRSEVLEKLEALDFNEWEQELMSNGSPRWKTIFLFCTVDCTKAGFLIKNKSTWILTKEGEEAMKNGTSNLLAAANKAYRKWFAENKKSEQPEQAGEETSNDSTKYQGANLELIEKQAEDGIIEFLNRKNPYEFQDIVAALLRAMGYYTAFIAERGKDGGVDIIAYQDVLGLKTPRLKVQVKHYPKNPVTVDPIRSLKGLLNQEEVGLFITSGTFTADAKRAAREAATHIKLIDRDEFIELWRVNYDKLEDEDKNMLPLRAIYFLGTND